MRQKRIARSTRRESPELETSPGAALALWQLHTIAEMN